MMEENKNEICGFEELLGRFPHLSPQDIPPCVIESAKETGNLTLEYLAYENKRLSEINEELLGRAAAADAGLGSQQNPDEGSTPLNEVFLRSLWEK